MKKPYLDKKIKILKTIRKGGLIPLTNGCVINILECVPPFIYRLRTAYLRDHECMEGDIEALFKYPGKKMHPELEKSFGRKR